MGQMGLAREHCDEQLAIAREIGHRKGEANALELSALIALFEGRVDDAGRMLDECLGMCRAMGSRRLEARALNLAGHVALGRGDRESARLLYEQALASRRTQGAREGMACSAFSLGRQLLESSLAEGGAPIPADAATSIASGSHVMRAHELERARPLLEEARDLTAEMGIVEPGPLPSACLALAGVCRASDVKIEGNVPAPVRAEAHLLLYRACVAHGEPPLDHLEQARALIERMATALVGAEREFFSTSSPLAKELRAAEVLQAP